MKAVIAHSLDSLDSYAMQDLPAPAPAAGELLIEVQACGVGYVDALVALGRYQVKPPLPHVPGQEVAGIVVAVGDGVQGYQPGDRVMGMAGRGFAQQAILGAAMAIPIPARLSFAQAAAFPLNYLTAWHGLMDRGQLQAGELVLVFGAAGGVGSAAVQVAKAAGAKVVAVASTSEKRDFALKHGADAVLDSDPEGWRDRLKAVCADLGAKGPDVVFDPVCGPLFELAFRSLHWRGRHLVVGFVGGPIPALPANLTLMKGAALMGVDVRQYLLFDGKQVAKGFAQLLGWVEAGAIQPPLGRIYNFEEFGAALQDAASGKGTGKVVLQVAGAA